MATIVIALISFTVAFLAGGILSKAYFAVQAGDGGNDQGDDGDINELESQRRHYRRRISALQKMIKRHERAQSEIKTRLREIEKSAASNAKMTVEARREAEDLRARLELRDGEVAAARERVENLGDELSLLRIERDELLVRVQRSDIDNDADSSTAAGKTDSEAAALRAELGEMREKLSRSEHHVRELELRVAETNDRNDELVARLESWKHRVKPLTAKLKQQRNLINEFRELEAAGAASRSAADDEVTDNLKRIRGIGPALERRLHRHGIRRFEQIADLSDHELAEIAEQLAIAPNLAKRDRWIEQARELAGRDKADVVAPVTEL